MKNDLRDEIQAVAEFTEDEGLLRVGDLVRRLQREVDQLEQRASTPVELSACPGCRHWSLSGFKHCPLCGSLKKQETEP